MHADFQPCVYIMASARHGTLYTGVTSHLIQRVCQHRDGRFGGFTDRYGVKRLVWFDLAGTMHDARCTMRSRARSRSKIGSESGRST